MMKCEVENELFERLKPALFFWAKHFKSKQFEFWELVNAAWLDNRWRKVKPEYHLQAIRYAMQDYIRKVTHAKQKHYFRKKGKHWPKQCRLSYELAASKKPNRFEQQDFINIITKRMTRTRRLIMKLKYLEGYNYTEIAAVIGVTPAWVHEIHSDIIGKLRYKMAVN